MKPVAYIPARKDSKRLPGKNVKPFFGVPLIAYTINAAKESGLFDYIIVSTDDTFTGAIAERYGAMYLHRPAGLSYDQSPDILWIEDAIRHTPETESFFILRPTSPFRSGETIRAAWESYHDGAWMKAVERVKQHPEKMWITDSKTMHPYSGDDSISHSWCTQFLPDAYVQNGSLEIRPFNDPEPTVYQPFFTHGYEGFDINTYEDWILAEVLVGRSMVILPKVGL